MASESKKFYQIIIQSKDDKEDFRAFCHCEDKEGNKWELRGYGTSAATAAADAWLAYVGNDWEADGHIVKSFE